jgi:branched-chain amino acid transport system ATP-binding protein
MLTVDQMTYGRAENRLHEVTFTVPDGAMAVLTGPSDAGPSLLLATVAGHSPVHAGTISICGHDTTGWPAMRTARYVAYAPRRHRVWPNLTVADHLHLAWPLTRARRTTRDQALALFPALAERMRQQAAGLSDLEARMLGLAVALLRNKPLLLLDEPCLGLPPAAARALTDHLQELKKARTAVVAVDSTGTLQRPDLILTVQGSTMTTQPPALAKAGR